ncbi:MAG: integration host factor subunit beta [Desulfobacteraceae bacterium]|nr:integration host factor subunit beta [Pseudomonadota bacterium]MBU4463836.1 integration host factor subunit beta [Pseudomonadota bacterium]MCG2754337.1 integration host factor subunit beta [Desulfobacteraceae bacterium]NQT09678.1 integration host factor subunit beta [Desulfobacteraceae bacterium]
MNRVDLINAFKDKTGISRKRVKKIIDTFFGTITKTLSNGKRVEIRGFGSFTVKKYKTYKGRNPKTGKQIKVHSKKLPFFKVGKELKDMVDN